MTQQSQPAGRPSSATASTHTSLFEAARAVIPGGVDSPVRAFGSVGGTPRFIASASGAHVTDAEGRSYVDLVGSWGPALLGHAHPEVVATVQAAAAPELERVTEELQLTSFLVTYDGEAAVTLLSAQPRDLDAMVVQRPGSRHSIDVGAPGRVIRSQLDPATYPPARYEVSQSEVIEGLTSIAVPIVLPQSRPAALAALLVARPVAEEEIVERLATTSRGLPSACGDEPLALTRSRAISP